MNLVDMAKKSKAEQIINLNRELQANSGKFAHL